MKPSVAITLILCGVLVVAIPALSHAWDALMVSVTLPRIMPNGSMNIGALSDSYVVASWSLGALMIGVAIVSSIVGRPGERRTPAATVELA